MDDRRPIFPTQYETSLILLFASAKFSPVIVFALHGLAIWLRDTTKICGKTQEKLSCALSSTLVLHIHLAPLIQVDIAVSSLHPFSPLHAPFTSLQVTARPLHGTQHVTALHCTARHALCTSRHALCTARHGTPRYWTLSARQIRLTISVSSYRLKFPETVLSRTTWKLWFWLV